MPSDNVSQIIAGQSVVWLLHPRFNALLETLWTRSGHDTQTTVNPGIRWSYDLPRRVQVVPGISFPLANHHGGRAVLLYLSVEHPFRTRSES